MKSGLVLVGNRMRVKGEKPSEGGGRESEVERKRAVYFTSSVSQITTLWTG